MKPVGRGWTLLVLGCLSITLGCGDDNGGVKADSGAGDGGTGVDSGKALDGGTRLDMGAGQDAGTVEVNKDLPGSTGDAAVDTPPIVAVDLAADAVDVAADANDDNADASIDTSSPADLPSVPDVPLTGDDAGPDSPISVVVDAGLDATEIDGTVAPALDAGVDAEAMDAAVAIDSAASVDVGIDTAAPATVVPTAENGVFTFQSNGVALAVDSTKGARVITYSLGGTNVVTTTASDANNYGSTFWPSPQSAWNWPPPADIDPGAYSGGFADGALTLTSATSAALGLSVRKRFAMDASTGDLSIRYSLLNQSTSSQSYAPWEITRVAPSGIVFFPMGSGDPRKGSQDMLNLTVSDGIAWFAYDASAITADQKVFADGAEGWIAHVDGGVVVIKSFTDISLAQAAPSEAEIEIFANAAHTYVEVENQGAYAPIDPSAASTWDVGWYMRAVPSNITVAVGSTDLVDFVRGVIAAH